MNFKRFSTSDNQWHDVPYYQHKTATDTITTLPAVIYPNASTVTVGLKGNTVQNGTPTPQNPVVINGTGGMSSNLFDITAFVQGIVPTRCTTSYDSTTNTLTIEATGNDAHTGNNNTYHIPVTGGETYTLRWITNSQGGYVYIFENGLTDSSHLHYWDASLNKGTVTMRNDTTFIIVRVGCTIANVTKTYTNIRLNVGSTSLSYEPYGYKIPISCGGTTTPVYLGEVQTVRQIKKLVLDGSENWNVESQTNFYTDVIASALKNKTVVCTHQLSTSTLAQGENCFISTSGRFNFTTSTIEHTAEAFKAYLSAQYAAGTPVTVWYVLATPETEVINEPLMKIGNYADSLTTSIPCTAGENTLDVQTTVQPSEVTANYQGWHSVQSVHERENGQWD